MHSNMSALTGDIKMYTSIEQLINAELGNKGHIIFSPECEISGIEYPAEFWLENVSSPVGGARKNIIGWFDGQKNNAIERI